MKTGRSIIDLAKELQRQAESKKDIVAPTSLLDMTPDASLSIRMSSETSLGEVVPVQHTAHRQIGTKLSIPAAYYDRMLQNAPALLASNVNHWFHDKPKPHLVRMLDGHVRAFLSDRYQRIDNYEVAEAVLPILSEMGVKIASAEVTAHRLYIKAVNEAVRQDVAVGDTVEAGVLITNSEIGLGALTVQPLIHRLICLNGMVVNDARFRRNHVGKSLDVDNDASRYLTDETVAQTDKAILMQARDVVRGALNETLFGETVAKMREAAGHKIEGDITQRIQVLGKTVGLMPHETSGVLATLIEHGAECGGMTRYGLVNAVTRFAQTVESYDRSTELEAIGGKILDLPRTEWASVAQAA